MSTPTSILPDAIAVSLDIVSKESAADKILSVDFLGVLAGVVIGGLVTFGTQYLLDKKRKIEERKALSAAFFGEVYALMSLTDTREYLEIYFREYLFLETTENYPHFGPYLQMQFDTYFSVYNSNVAKIGILDPDVIPLITDFYLKVFSIMEDMTKIPKSKWETAQQLCPDELMAQKTYTQQLKDALAQDIIMLIKVIDEGKQICNILSSRYGFQYEPFFQHIKSYSDFINQHPFNCFIPAYQEQYKKDYLNEDLWDVYSRCVENSTPL